MIGAQARQDASLITPGEFAFNVLCAVSPAEWRGVLCTPGTAGMIASCGLGFSFFADSTVTIAASDGAFAAGAGGGASA
eukprot:CAMPEP_0201721566 /NCGR_PEP_ID=MMETSP0593-20130828/6217_1 /ASSEMBLY_ACC=CAM_ASM_000672 /TAXON_ID=267983 /ORGANISM="Skeletonema japonicum, Strain CCMP2506" /LENGTH=78 /DNA_ID=CAMNT_0048212401 /DNA_START=12 /DNA_END=245 /DNA_ORIENTATION=+